MLNKIVTTLGSYALRTVSNTLIDKSVQKINRPYNNFNRKLKGISSLNVGEEESLRCYKYIPHDSTGFCRRVMEYEINKYNKTGKYK